MGELAHAKLLRYLDWNPAGDMDHRCEKFDLDCIDTKIVRDSKYGLNRINIPGG